MYGLGILRGLGVTLKHFIDTYLDDVKYLGKKAIDPDKLNVRQSLQARGLFAVQYPEEKLEVPERFRYIPFLIYETDEQGNNVDRCTSCGICAKVCPPQCIWIERVNDPATGRPIPAPKDFFIDVDICMNCGSCAEFCPFDAIKMDHDYEIASYDRTKEHIFDKVRLDRPLTYYAEIRPTFYKIEEDIRAEKERQKAEKEREKAEKAAAKKAAAQKAAAQAAGAKIEKVKDIEGINARTAFVLKKAGIGTLEELAAASVDQLKSILEAASLDFDPTTWPQQAKQALAPAAATALAQKIEKVKDVEGINARTAFVLKKAGITNLEELAAASVDQLKSILADASLDFDPTTWPEQAKQALAAPAAPPAEPEPKIERVKDIEGINARTAFVLKKAGITNLEELAAAPVDQLKSILEAAGLDFDPTTWPQQAKQAVASAPAKPAAKPKAETKPEPAAKPTKPAAKPKPDDLKKIEGIGPKTAGVLNQAGISTFAELAATSVDKLQAILDEAEMPKVIVPETWPEQAKLAAAGKWDELQALQDKLSGGKKGS